ncbi:MAG TPA: hypothetical protein VJ697_02985 [Nitrososphaeraceae archaeon]|nr:hypothetical protein [Nitrososphaeraceae archaeon]
MSKTTTMTITGTMILFAVGIIFSSPMAASAVPFTDQQQQDNFLDLKNAKLRINDNVITDALFTAKGDIPRYNPGINWGYGIITAGGNVIVTTSHPELPIADSELQNGDPTNDVIHNHYVVLTTTNALCGPANPQNPTAGFNPSVEDLTVESPGDIFVKQNLALLKNLPPSVTGGNFDPARVFTPGADYQAAASFQLKYVEDTTDPTKFAVCVVDIRALDPLEESTVIIGEKDMKPDYPRPDYGNNDGYGNEYSEEYNDEYSDEYHNNYLEDNSYDEEYDDSEYRD